MFSYPVDPDRDSCPTYFQVVKNPMDLGTIREKLEGNSYDSVADFKADIELVWENAISFNGRNSYIGLLAKQLQTSFREKSQFFSDDEKEDWLLELNELRTNLNNILSLAPQTKQQMQKNAPQQQKKISRMSSTPAPISSHSSKSYSQSSSKSKSKSSSSHSSSSSSHSSHSSSSHSHSSSGSNSTSNLSQNPKPQSQPKPKPQPQAPQKKSFSPAEIEQISMKVNAIVLEDDQDKIDKVLELIKNMEPEMTIEDEIELTLLKPETLVALQKLVDTF